jgi:hypothetical protein
MENYDPRRGQKGEDPSRRERSERDYEGSDDHRDRRELSDERQRDERGSQGRYGEPRGGRESWRDRPDVEPEYRREGERYNRGESGEWRGDENRRTTAEQRARGFTPREQRDRDDEQGSHYRGYYSREVRPFSYPGGSGALYMESWTLTGPYTGRGPKGYKRSDEQILEEACQRLERDGQIDASEIEVSAEDGVIRLRGTVPDRPMKRRAEECVESIYGTRDVMNELRVAPQGEESSQGSRGSERSRGTRKSPTSSSQTSQASTASGTTGTGATSAEPTGENKQTPKH